MALGRALVCLLGLLAAGCTSGDGAEQNEAVDRLIVEAEPTTSAFDPSDTDQLAGTSTSPDKIQDGDCFNEYVFSDRSGFLQQITTLVSCDGPHDREAYFATTYPGDDDASYPLEDTLRRWAAAACLDEFEDFVGLEYVLSELEIGAVIPTFDSWTERDDRNVICYVYPDESGFRLRDSVERSGI